MAMSHTGHNHPATPAGRAACRKAMKAGLVQVEGPVSAAASASADRVAAAIATAFQGARATKNKACVQSALHKGSGRCACGWVGTCTIEDTHCEQCGQVDPGHHEGYTACCNELVAYGSKDCRNHHA